MRQLLSDVAVLELATDPAGSYCGKVFADLGADVVKVESPDGRPRAPAPRAVPAPQHQQARRPHRRRRRRPRAAARPRCPRRRGDREQGRRRPRRVRPRARRRPRASSPLSSSRPSAASARPGPTPTTRGPTSPRRPRLGSRSRRAARSRSRCAHRASPPSVRSDTLRHWARWRARCERGASGEGAHVDVAAFEALGSIPARVCRYLGWEYAEHEPLGLAASAADTLLPIGIFPCADGYVSMMSTPQQLTEMLEVIDDDALTAAFSRPEAFSDPGTKEILDTALYPWLFEHTRAEATAKAQAGQWPLAGVYTPAEVMEADHFHQRGFWVDCDDPVLGKVLLAGPPVPLRRGRLAAAPPRTRGADGAAGGAEAQRPAGAGQRQPRRAAAPRHPGPRLHHGVVGSVPHAAARRPRRRGDPGREPVGVPAHHQGLPAAAARHDAPRQPAVDVRARPSTVSTTGRTTGTR